MGAKSFLPVTRDGSLLTWTRPLGRQPCALLHHWASAAGGVGKGESTPSTGAPADLGRSHILAIRVLSPAQLQRLKSSGPALFVYRDQGLLAARLGLARASRLALAEGESILISTPGSPGSAPNSQFLASDLPGGSDEQTLPKLGPEVTFRGGGGGKHGQSFSAWKEGAAVPVSSEPFFLG